MKAVLLYNKYEVIILDKNFSVAHPLLTTPFPVCAKLLAENIKDIEKRHYPEILFLGSASLILYPAYLLEKVLYINKALKKPIQDPVFITGHWRTGTTFLHYIMSRDKSFGYVDPFMNYSLNFYHILGRQLRPIIQGQLDLGRPMDNLKYGTDMPFEDYNLFATTEAKSFYPLNFFPQSFKKYSRYAFVGKLDKNEREHWVNKQDKLFRRIAYINGGKRLLLKSPDCTGRVGVLQKEYPGAKFVNIYRDPYTVVRSTIHMFNKMFALWSLEKLPAEEEMEDLVIDMFKEMYETFFEDIKKLPEGSFYEIKFEDFEKDPLPILKDMYEKLNLGDYEKARPGFEEHWNSVEGYQKNVYDYPERLKKKVNDKLGFYFEHYGYEMKEI